MVQFRTQQPGAMAQSKRVRDARYGGALAIALASSRPLRRFKEELPEDLYRCLVEFTDRVSEKLEIRWILSKSSNADSGARRARERQSVQAQ